MNLDAIEIATDLLTVLTTKLLREHNLPPEVVARLMVGGGVYIFMHHNTGGATAAIAHLRQSADELEALCAPKPSSEIH